MEDINYIKRYLNESEYELFLRLSEQEQKHSVKVAMDVQRECRRLHISENDLIKTALLHDIGKIYIRLNAIDKSIMVLADKFTRGKIRKLKNSKKIRVYFDHGTIGCEMLKNSGLSDRVLYLIKNHHNDIIDDEELDILKRCDSNN
jgi:putative nucleotidyltransferase with HDIG domain